MSDFKRTPTIRFEGNKLLAVLKKLHSKIKELFEPEEVEVDFKQEGNRIRYTYKKIERKQAA